LSAELETLCCVQGKQNPSTCFALHTVVTVLFYACVFETTGLQS
jgi:hypothetical protein